MMDRRCADPQGFVGPYDGHDPGWDSESAEKFRLRPVLASGRVDTSRRGRSGHPVYDPQQAVYIVRSDFQRMESIGPHPLYVAGSPGERFTRDGAGKRR